MYTIHTFDGYECMRCATLSVRIEIFRRFPLVGPRFHSSPTRLRDPSFTKLSEVMKPKVHHQKRVCLIGGYEIAVAEFYVGQICVSS